MARMNWDAARDREIVQSRGGEFVGADFRRDEDSPRRGSKSKSSASKVRCSISDKNHQFGRSFSVRKPPGARAKQCANCGKIQVITSRTAQPIMVPSREKLMRRLSRLEGRTLEGSDTERIIRSSASASKTSRPAASTPSAHKAPFTLEIHVVHEFDSSPRWVCFCSWRGSDTSNLANARELHRQNWESLPQTDQKAQDIESIRGILEYLRRRD